jgi:hypothetical protein
LSAPKTDVEAFEKSDYFMVGGDETKMGNHLTVGLILNQQKLVMVAHVNHYTYLHDTANTFFDERIECNTYLQHPLLPSTQCQTAVGPSLYTVKTRFEAIYPVVPAILTRLAQVYVEGPNASQSTGDQLAIGPRGGRYIMKHGRRKYLKGGADPIVYKGTGFSDELMAFLARHIIGPVVAIKDDLEMIRVFYDDFNEVAPMANENIVFQYEFRHGEMQIFYVDALKALQAFYASTAANPTIAERRCLEDITAGRAFQVLVVV